MGYNSTMPLQRDPAKWANATCAVCGKSFDHRADRPRQFCSMVCTGVGRVKTPRPSDPKFKAETVCPTCGKAFSYWLSWPRKYCSRPCAGVALSATTQTRYAATCEVCGERFSRVLSQPGRFCGQTCFGRWLSENRRGENNPQTGRRYELPAQQKRVTLTCQQCGAAYVVKMSHQTRSHFCSKPCLGAWQSENLAGENNRNWLGGHDPYYGPSWRPAMRAVRARDKVCTRCGKSPKDAGKALDVHHLKPFRTFGRDRHEEANRLDNLVALCPTCHTWTEWDTNRRSG